MKTRLFLPVSLSCLFSIGSSLGVQAQAPPDATKQVSLREIVEEQSRIRDAVARNDPAYAHLDALRRSRLIDAQARVFDLTGRAAASRGLSADDQLALFNELKKVEALLNKRDADDRMVCERIALSGTRRHQMACMTRAEREAKADSVRKALMERQACTTQECVGGE